MLVALRAGPCSTRARAFDKPCDSLCPRPLYLKSDWCLLKGKLLSLSCNTRSSFIASATSPPQQKAKEEEIIYLQLDLPPPSNSRVRKSAFVKSSIAVKDCPHDQHPEFAVIGRSNVGKSSLINALADNDKLAKTSKEPGALLQSLIC